MRQRVIFPFSSVCVFVHQPCPQGLLGIFQNGGSLRHFEKYPEGPWDEVVRPLIFFILASASSSLVNRPFESTVQYLYVLHFLFCNLWSTMQKLIKR